MPRRGWSAVPTPAGWFEVIRGLRPPSVQWPKGKGKGKLDDGANVKLLSGAGSGRPVGRWKRGGVCPSEFTEGSQFGSRSRCVGSRGFVGKD